MMAISFGVISMNKNRCAWCLSDPLYVAYHDDEWGRVIDDDKELFACLCLEGMQAGLSWITILKRREAYYRAFDGFDAQLIASYDENKVNELMNDIGIIRHRAKIMAIIHNANAYLKIKQTESFYDYLYRIVRQYGDFPQDNCPNELKDTPAKTPASTALAKQLKKDGFKFVGATTCYAFMQAVGMVNDHVAECEFRDNYHDK